MELRFLTLNCQGGYRRAELQQFLEELLRKGAHDFILLQHLDSTGRELLPDLKQHKYGILQAENPDLKGIAHECIIFRQQYAASDAKFLSFAQFRRPEEKGAIAGRFTLPDGERIIVCSTHLHSQEHALVRRKEALALKRFLMALDPESEVMTVVGGDFNNMFFRELQLMIGYMRPEFTHCTIYDTHSHDTTHLEQVSFLTRLFAFMGRRGLRMRTKLDHIFVDSRSAQELDFEAKVYEVTVSDHKPVELRMRRKQQMRRE
jgi:endonuclease/exonuclease/phosphatase family metal-dependent hydrolase